MARAEQPSEKLAALKTIAGDLRTSQAKALLRKSLSDRSSRVVTRAAEFIGETDDLSFAEPLVAAFRRLLDDALKRDPGCLAKTAIVKALVQLEHADADIYRHGVSYEQHEPIWGGSKDAAAELRAVCAFGLVSTAPSLEVLNRCAVLLQDPCTEARAGAAQAIGALGQPEGAPLLRLKLLVGDLSAEVVGECCAALLVTDRVDGLAFVAQFLASPIDNVCVQAALALGASRRADAFAPLRETWQRHRSRTVRESLLVCVGLLRSPESRDFLLSLVRGPDRQAGADAISALKAYAGDRQLREQIQSAVSAIDDRQLAKVFEDQWPLD